MTKKTKNVRKGLKNGLETVRIERDIVPILGVAVDSTKRGRVLSQVTSFLEKNRTQARVGQGQEFLGNLPKLFVATPNPEIVNLASREASLRKILGQASLCVPDGIGIIMAQRFLRMQVPKFPGVTQLVLLGSGLWVGISAIIARDWLISFGETVPGRLLFEDLVSMSAKKGWKVFLLGGGQGIAEKAADIIQNSKFKTQNYNSKFKIYGEAGPRLDMNGLPLNSEEAQVEQDTIERINAFKPDFLFIGFGAPKQEYWLWRNLPKLDIKVGMVVGGTFDSIAGTVFEAPRFVSEIGLEWFWRLVTQPWRLPRILTAVFVFPLKVFIWRLRNG
mgnify:CR=1 FL=1